VVAAACFLPEELAPIPGVGDSKTITSEAERERLYEEIVAAPGVLWAARIVPAARVDEINILMASLEAMRLSIVDVLEQSRSSTELLAKESNEALVFVDGPFSPWKAGAKYADFQSPPLPSFTDVAIEPIKGGDGKVYCIAAASILAKVTRDRAMRLFHAEWPGYGLAAHKGYGTREHVRRIGERGACAIHRRSFAPLKEMDLPPPSAEELRRVEEIVGGLVTSGRTAEKGDEKSGEF